MTNLRNPVRDQARAHAERTTTEIRGVSSDFNEDGLGGPSKRDSAMAREAREMMLDMLVPDEPLPPPVLPPPSGDPFSVRGETVQKAWKRAYEKRARLPGYQPGYRGFRLEPIGPLPPADAPTHDWTTSFVRDAKGCWCEDAQKGQTNEQSGDWLPIYLRRTNTCADGRA